MTVPVVTKPLPATLHCVIYIETERVCPTHLVIAPMFLQQGDYRLDVSSLDDVQGFRAFNEDAVQDFNNSYNTTRQIRGRSA